MLDMAGESTTRFERGSDMPNIKSEIFDGGLNSDYCAKALQLGKASWSEQRLCHAANTLCIYAIALKIAIN